MSIQMMSVDLVAWLIICLSVIFVRYSDKYDLIDIIQYVPVGVHKSWFFVTNPTVCGACYNMRLAGCIIIGVFLGQLLPIAVITACLFYSEYWHDAKWEGKADVPMINKFLNLILPVAPYLSGLLFLLEN